ncbi:isocitrate lyase/phosphoenolpyruvate mutase family protein [Flavobacterium sp. H122]|uniref:isocitrate lyase/PEP mutase family protein n=1 Tax=Flavobacterium sp. H122 TaxID=2529860 RepID=UPI0010AB21C4|nr:isocitrate lyase/phosphoenolpyruvate mutase family protein [Flavobacterium sp. H122]
MKSKVQIFRELHTQNQPLLLGNVWNVQSAKIYENSRYQAIGTSSAAVAHSLGYEDGENMPFEDYLFIIKKIAQNTTLPLTVDLEAGFGNTAGDIFKNIQTLHSLDVAGINIEDSTVFNSKRQIEDKNKFSHKLTLLINLLKQNNIDIFINIRCDAFLLQLPNTLNEAIERIKLYQTISIDGIFLPCITNEKDIKEVIKKTDLPVNVMCMPDLPDFETLSGLGVKRISMGNFINGFGYKKMEETAQSILTGQNFQSLF